MAVYGFQKHSYGTYWNTVHSMFLYCIEAPLPGPPLSLLFLSEFFLMTINSTTKGYSLLVCIFFVKEKVDFEKITKLFPNYLFKFLTKIKKYT